MNGGLSFGVVVVGKKRERRLFFWLGALTDTKKEKAKDRFSFTRLRLCPLVCAPHTHPWLGLASLLCGSSGVYELCSPGGFSTQIAPLLLLPGRTITSLFNPS